MVKQMWYQEKGKLTTGPPPKYFIPKNQSAIWFSIARLIYISISKQQVNGVQQCTNELPLFCLFNFTPGWCYDTAHWPSSRVLFPRWNCPQWNVQELIKNHMKSVFYLLYHLIFIAIAFAVHHCGDCHFTKINSRWIEPELIYNNPKTSNQNSIMHLIQRENSGKSVVPGWPTHLM